jgi:hypothetical protein
VAAKSKSRGVLRKSPCSRRQFRSTSEGPRPGVSGEGIEADHLGRDMSDDCWLAVHLLPAGW